MPDRAPGARRAAMLAAALCLAMPAAAPAVPAAAGVPTLDPEEQALCAMVNSYRAEHGLPPLRVSVTLTKASQWQSADMARNDYVAHTDSLGRNFSRRISAFGYRGATRGENVAAGAASAAATLVQWRASPPHRHNLLNRRLQVFGIGRASNADGRYGWYWATAFGGKPDRTMPC